MKHRPGITALLTAAILLIGGTHVLAQCTGQGKSCCAGKKDGAAISMKEITRSDLKSMMRSETAFTLVDARDSEAYQAGHIGAALHVDNAVLPTDKNAPIVFYCGGFKCGASVKAAKKAIAQGYTNVMVYRGGWAEWNQS